MNPSNAFNFWTPHLSWYLLALRRGARCSLRRRRCARRRPRRWRWAWAWASATPVTAGFFLKFGTMWGNFPYFLAGVFQWRRAHFAFRDDWATAGRRAGAATVTAAAVAACFFGLRSGAMCFDAWQWEAWKSAPYGDYLFVDAQTPSGTSEWHLWESIAAPLFRLGTYFGSVAVGAAFLAAVPRAEIPAATKMGARTMTVPSARARAPGGVGVRRDVREGVRRGWAERGGVHRRGGGAAHFGDGGVHDRARRVGVPVAVRARNRGVALARGDGARDAGKRHQPRLGEVRDARSSPRIIDR